MASGIQWASIVVVLFAASCSGSNDTPGSAGHDGGVPDGTTASGGDASGGDASLTGVSGTIGSAGGVVATGNGGATLTIPPGAIATATTITITPSTSNVPGSVGQVWEIGPTGTQFSVPVTLTLAYADAELGGNPAADFSVSTVVSGAWQPIAATIVSPSSHTISGQTTHLSPYALAAQPPASDGGTESSGGDAAPAVDAGSGDGGGLGTDAGDASSGCSSGTCLVTLATGQTNPQSLTVDGTSVYWTTAPVGQNGTGTVMKVPIGGGTATPLATSQNRPFGVVVDGANAYYTTTTQVIVDGGAVNCGTVTSVPLAGGSPPVTLTALSGVYVQSMINLLGDYPMSFALGGSTLYFTTVDGMVESLPVGGGSPTVLAGNMNFGNLPPSAQGIAVDGTGVYVACAGDGGPCTSIVDGGDVLLDILNIAVTGGTPTPVSTANLGQNYAVAVDATNVYWTDNSGFIFTAPKNGTGTITALASGEDSGTSAEPLLPTLAVDATSVYWTDYETGFVRKVAKGGGGTPVTIASGQHGAYGIAVDATSVYWTAAPTGQASGVVMKATPK